MKLTRTAILAACLLTLPAFGQGPEGALTTQMLVRADSKADVLPTADTIKLELDSKTVPISSLTAVKPSGLQLALLIDDGLSRSAGIELDDMRAFLKTLPPDMEVTVGYMANGTVRVAQPFSLDHAAAAAAIRLPQGVPGESASPYFCLSDFVKHWPGAGGEDRGAKARMVLMITNGVDPYNGSTSLSNQDSPYVAASALDAQKAGVAVYSIYYRDAGFPGGVGSLSGQSYLQQVAAATGGETFYEGNYSPVSLAPYFKQFVHAIAESYVATFQADAAGGGREHLVRVKMSTSIAKVKLRHADAVRPGNRETIAAGSQP